MLMALLGTSFLIVVNRLNVSTGEMHFLPYEPNSWFNLPRDGGVAYAAQESWVLNDTIRVWLNVEEDGFLMLSRVTSFLVLHSIKIDTKKVS